MWLSGNSVLSITHRPCCELFPLEQRHERGRQITGTSISFKSSWFRVPLVGTKWFHLRFAVVFSDTVEEGHQDEADMREHAEFKSLIIVH